MNSMGNISQKTTGFEIKQLPKGKSWLIIGKEKAFRIETDVKFNSFQKFMWKKCFNVTIEDIKE